ncbi:MAG: HDIG domain-containing protein [Candidatus Riflebacteria bacterium]|nr:HDIG domain-containing protein [Candidatus Riflebacteria bacterium]
MKTEIPAGTTVFLSSFLAWLEIPEKRQKVFISQLAVFFGAMVLILFLDPSGFSPEVMEGSVCPKTIRSPKNISFVDERKTDELRKLEEEKVEPVITQIPNAETEMLNRFDRFLNELTPFYEQAKKGEYREINSAVIASYFPADRLLDSDNFKELVTLKKNEFDRLKKESRQILQNFSQSVITVRNLENVRNRIKRDVLDLPGGALFRRLMIEILKNGISVNAIEDTKETRERRDAASKSVAPVKRNFQKGQKLIDEGVIVTADDIYVLRTVEKQLQKNQVMSLAGHSIMALLLIIISLAHLRLTRQGILVDPHLFRLLGALWLSALLLGRIVIGFGSAYELQSISILLTPLPSIGLLMATLLDCQVAVFHQMLLGILTFVLAEANAKFAIVSLMGGVAGVLTWNTFARDANIRRSIGASGLQIGITNSFLLLSLILLDTETLSLMDMKSIAILVGCGFGNGILSGILANGALPYIESVLPLATGSRLLELADLSQPLLKRLSEEAPGTYQHSIMVAALSEAAALEVGADPLLAKIGAYFHDIGKLKRPHYFAENQVDKNRHDVISPYLSSLILIGHVKDGVDLAREYSLPDRVTSFIREHHGTTLISYFYQQAKTENDGNKDISEDSFRYSGPKPQTRESAIVMLADSVEAASRTLPQHNIMRLEGLVGKIVENKFKEESQLDESDLTLKDIEKISGAFVKVLSSIYHGRIDYPGKLSNQPKGGTDGSPDKQPPKEDKD